MRAEVAEHDHEDDEGGHQHEAGEEQGVDLRAVAAAEAPEAGRQGQREDEDDVRDPLQEDRANRPRDRGRVRGPQQVGAVQVAQLGRHQAVHEPGQEEDLGRVAVAHVGADVPQHQPPPQAAQREGQVVDDEGRQQVGGDRGSDQLHRLAEVHVQDDAEQEEDQDQREDDGADRSPVQQAPLEADLRLGDRLVRRRVQELARLVDGVAVLVRAGRVLGVVVLWAAGVSPVTRRLRILRVRQLGGGWPLYRLLFHLLWRLRPKDGRRGGLLAHPIADHVAPHRPAGGEVDEDRGAAAVPVVHRERRAQLVGALEDGQRVEAHGDLEGGVAVRAGDPRHLVAGRQLGRLLVVALERHAAVEDLDHVDLARLEQADQRLLANVRLAERVVGMRDRDQAALLVDGIGRLIGGEAARDGPLQEEPDHLAVGRGDLLAQDDRQLVRQAQLRHLVADGDRSLHVVVVGDGHVGQAALQRRCG